MIEIQIGLDGVPSQRSITLGNKYENKDEQIHFDLPTEFDSFNKYLIGVIKNSKDLENPNRTVILPVVDNIFTVSSSLTYYPGKWDLYLMCREHVLNLEDDLIDISPKQNEHVFISDRILGIVSDSSISEKNLENIPMDENLQILYDDLLALISEVKSDLENGAYDGFSPTIAITDIVGGHHVVITDRDGVKEFDVFNGEDYEHSEEFEALSNQVRDDASKSQKALEDVNAVKTEVESIQSDILESKTYIDQVYEDADALHTSIQTIETSVNEKTEQAKTSAEAALASQNTAKASEKNAKTSETNAKSSSDTALETLSNIQSIKTEIDRLAQQVSTDASSAASSAQTAQQAMTQANQIAEQNIADLNASKTSALEEIDTGKSTATKAVQDAQTSATASIEATKQSAVGSVQTAQTEATEAISGAKTTAQTEITTAKDTAVKAVQSTQQTAVQAVDTAKTSATQEITEQKESAVSAITQERSEAIEAIETVKTSVESTKAEIDKTKGEINAVKEEVNTAKQDVDNTKQEISEIKTSVEATKTAVDSVKESVEATKTEVESAKSSVDASVTTVNETKSQIDTIKTQIDTTKTQIDTKAEEVATSAQQVSDAKDQAETAKTAAETASQQANQSATSAQEALSNMQELAETVEEKVDSLSKYSEETIGLYYNMQRDGRVYQTRFYKFETNPTSEGTKMLANANLVCEPSTSTEQGQDDYANIPLFQWVHCNYKREADGTPYPVAIEGDENYKTTGAVDVGSMMMSFWYKVEENGDYIDYYISDSPNALLGLKPWVNCMRADGTTVPWNIYSSYFSGLASDGKLHSQPNLRPENFQSYQNMVTNYGKKGNGYFGAGVDLETFQILMIAIKYGTKNSQSVFKGTTNYNFQYQAAVQRSEKDTYFPVTQEQKNNIIVGSSVYVGYPSDNNGQPNYDRGVGTMREYANMAKVLRIEDDGDNAKVYLDCDPFDTMPKTVGTISAQVTISSMHWYSGTTDKVIGHHDGSEVDSDKYPYRVQGIEYAVGGYLLASDTIMDIQADMSKIVYKLNKGAERSSNIETIKANSTVIGTIPAADGSNDYWIGDVGIKDGAWYPKSKGTGNTTGAADRIYFGGTVTSGQREYLMGGSLGGGSYAGACFLSCWCGLSGALWHFLAHD